MKAKKVCTPSKDFLQELSKDLRPISQRELRDLVKSGFTLYPPDRIPLAEFNARLENSIFARLQVGIPVRKGKLTAILEKSGFKILRGEEILCEPST